MMAFMDKHEIDPKKVHSSGVKSSTKMSLISLARELGTYFARVYPVSSSDQDIEVQVNTLLPLVSTAPNALFSYVQYLAVTHTGLKLLRREKSLPSDFLNVSVDILNLRKMSLYLYSNSQCTLVHCLVKYNH